MIIAEIEVSSSYAMARQAGILPSDGDRKLCSTYPGNADTHLLPLGGCGLKVRFCFLDPAWENLSKTAVFRSNSGIIDAAITDDSAIVPHEMLAKAMDVVEVGVYGTDSGRNIAIPTVWTRLGTVAAAANPSGRSSAEPTLPYWAQLKEQLDRCQDEMMNQQDLENALIQAQKSGAFDGPKGDAGYSPVKGRDYWTKEEQESLVAEAAQRAAAAFQSDYDIINAAFGEQLTLTDSANRKLRGMHLYGKTGQSADPTPEAPAALLNAGADGIITVTLGASESAEALQVCTVSAPNGLPGIPVVSDGNYTDGNGQMWACDEIDLARGKYIQRIQKLELDGSENFRAYGTDGYYLDIANVGNEASPAGYQNNEQRLLCSHFSGVQTYPGYSNITHGEVVLYSSSTKCRLAFRLTGKTMAAFAAEQYAAGNPVTVIYQRSVPVETDLAADHVTGYAALYTTDPGTVVTNDAGVGLGVHYVADTKRYIDKKFAELAGAIMHNV